MYDANVTRHKVPNPNGFALQQMGRVAREAARTWTLRQLASRVATKAGPRDYVGQLRKLYDLVTKRAWRYTKELGEQVPGTPKALLGHVLGASYNGAKDPTRFDAWQATRRGSYEKGFGDCDDVATLMAAMALAIGMDQVYFRVARANSGAHVLVTVVTPKGRLVNLDPVGYPDKRFGWAPSGPGVQSEFYDMNGRRVSAPQGRQPSMNAPLGDALVSAIPRDTGEGYGGRLYDIPRTYFGEIDMAPMAARFEGVEGVRSAPMGVADEGVRGNVCIVNERDGLGPRVLAMPAHIQRQFAGGAVIDNAPAVDQYGAAWRYLRDIDAWVPAEGPRPIDSPLTRDQMDGMEPFQGRRSRRRRKRRARRRRVRARRRARRKRRRRAIRRGFKRFTRGVRRVARAVGRGIKKIAKSKLFQAAASAGLQALGVPAPVTAGALQAGSQAFGGPLRYEMWKLKRANPQGALAAHAAAIAADDMVRLGRGRQFGTVDFDMGSQMGDHMGSIYRMQQTGGACWAQPVAFMAAVDDVFDPAAVTVMPEATPGAWVRGRRGQSLLELAGEAYDAPRGSKERLEGAKRINNARANAQYRGPARSDFERRYIGDEVIRINPRWSSDTAGVLRGESGRSYPLIWVPGADGEEPPRVLEPEPPAPITEAPLDPSVTDPQDAEPGFEPGAIDPASCAAVGLEFDPQTGRCRAAAPAEIPQAADEDDTDDDAEEPAPMPASPKASSGAYVAIAVPCGTERVAATVLSPGLFFEEPDDALPVWSPERNSCVVYAKRRTVITPSRPPIVVPKEPTPPTVEPPQDEPPIMPEAPEEPEPETPEPPEPPMPPAPPPMPPVTPAQPFEPAMPGATGGPPVALLLFLASQFLK